MGNNHSLNSSNPLLNQRFQVYKAMREAEIVRANLMFRKKWIHPASAVFVIGFSGLLTVGSVIDFVGIWGSHKGNPLQMFIWTTAIGAAYTIGGYHYYDRKIDQNDAFLRNAERADNLFNSEPINPDAIDLSVELLLQSSRKKPHFWQYRCQEWQADFERLQPGSSNNN